jgi:mono/diheme cytochrome c family protein
VRARGWFTASLSPNKEDEEDAMKGLGKFGKDAGALTVASLVFVALLTLIPLSARPAGQKGNEAKGKFYFKQQCKSCHIKGEKGGEVTPLSKTQAQWQAYFAKGKHMKGTEPLTKYMTAEQLNDAQTFLYNHAVDSPQPETCGK